MNKQYIVQINGLKERKDFYNYIKKNYKLKIHNSKYHMIISKFPFVVDFIEKDFWVCESITCCACAQQANKILSKEKFLEIVE